MVFHIESLVLLVIFYLWFVGEVAEVATTRIVDVTVKNAWMLHKKSGGNMIHRILKENLVQTYSARYGTPPKKSVELLMSNNGGRKRVVDVLQYDGIEHCLVETPEKKR